MGESSFLQVAQKGSDTRRPKPGTRPEGVGLSVAFYAKKSRELRAIPPLAGLMDLFQQPVNTIFSILPKIPEKIFEHNPDR